MENETIKVTKEDHFVWLILIYTQAVKCWDMDCFELYRLYDDDSEGLIESRQELEEAMERGTIIGIEVGFLPSELNTRDKGYE